MFYQFKLLGRIWVLIKNYTIFTQHYLEHPHHEQKECNFGLASFSRHKSSNILKIFTIQEVRIWQCVGEQQRRVARTIARKLHTKQLTGICKYNQSQSRNYTLRQSQRKNHTLYPLQSRNHTLRQSQSRNRALHQSQIRKRTLNRSQRKNQTLHQSQSIIISLLPLTHEHPILPRHSLSHTKTETASAPWWQVTFPFPIVVNRIIIHTRKCCGSRINGATVYVGDVKVSVLPITEQELHSQPITEQDPHHRAGTTLSIYI